MLSEVEKPTRGVEGRVDVVAAEADQGCGVGLAKLIAKLNRAETDSSLVQYTPEKSRCTI